MVDNKSVALGVGTLLSGLVLLALILFFGFYKGDWLAALVSLVTTAFIGGLVFLAIFLIVLGAIILWL
ncbi:MAG TPA: hypothetical protein VGQ00_00625 [Candidatus Norongarragalinales archaeon]|jgi:hypothetical protein|nr:hypothetical protein [Candidatus Norongarragalinales archaeon]